jgi:chemotaxis protein histidine kinase CheA
MVIVRNMMSKMDGTIEITSREDVETVVTLNLPAGCSPPGDGLRA